MGPRAAWPALLGVALALAGCGGSGAPGQPGAGRPNVIVIMTDDQTVESMRVMPGVRSSLAAAGTTFERAFASTALCCPSRATLFTGQYMHNHGVLGNRPPEGGYGRLDTREYLPVWLQRAGYHTVHIGKFLNRYGQDSPPTEVPPGWSEWYASVDPSTYQYTGYQLNENGVVNRHARYQADEYTQRAVDAVARLSPGPTPFFMSLAYLAPHSGGPRDPDDPAGLVTPSPAPRHRDAFASEPPPRSAAFDEADVSDKPRLIRRLPRLSAARRAAIAENYRQELESLLAVDEGVVRVVDALRAAGELDNTLILFTSDNGFFHGEHRVPSGKVMVYEPAVAVPLIMRGPGVPRGARRRQLVTNADLAPTILRTAVRSSPCCATGVSNGAASCSSRDRRASTRWPSPRCETSATSTWSTTPESASSTTRGATPPSSRASTPIRPTLQSRPASPGDWPRCRSAQAPPVANRRAPGWSSGAAGRESVRRCSSASACAGAGACCERGWGRQTGAWSRSTGACRPPVASPDRRYEAPALAAASIFSGSPAQWASGSIGVSRR